MIWKGKKTRVQFEKKGKVVGVWLLSCCCPFFGVHGGGMHSQQMSERESERIQRTHTHTWIIIFGNISSLLRAYCECRRSVTIFS
mmetsp:Transcript_35446/g.54471  ORF Transcript_35446/g.54471 Transcript_35446/m.54471 type:complete len:85 (+) Transcript_35446:1474-1728(+)